MPKNVKKRKKGSRKQHKDLPFCNPEEGLYYAVIDKRCGGTFVDALCHDGKIRKIYLRGAIRKRVWMNPGDVVLVSLREELAGDNKCDIIVKYRPDVARQLQRQGALKFSKDHQPDSCLDSGTSQVTQPVERPTLESMMPPSESEDEYDDEDDEDVEKAAETIEDADQDKGKDNEDEGEEDEDDEEEEEEDDRWAGKNKYKHRAFKNRKGRREKGRSGKPKKDDDIDIDAI